MLRDYQTDCEKVFLRFQRRPFNAPAPRLAWAVPAGSVRSPISWCPDAGLVHASGALAGGLKLKIISRSQLMPEQDMTSLTPADTERLKLAFQQCRDMEGTLKEQLQA